MTKITKFTSAAVLMIFANIPYSANAEVTRHQVSVDQILLSQGEYGECLLRVSPFTAPGICAANWVSLDCTGDFQSKEVSRRFLEAAQMSMALDRQLVIYVTDRELHNGHCVVKRIDLLK